MDQDREEPKVREMTGVGKRRLGDEQCDLDPYRRTPPLSLAGSCEVEEEMAQPPADTPERHALFERVRRKQEGRDRWTEISRRLNHLDELLVLDEQGSREVIDEIVNGSPLTHERRATLERMRLMAEVQRRSDQLDPTPPPDHEGFVEVRALGFRAVRQKLAGRRKHP
jgi:hypothetical protein